MGDKKEEIKPQMTLMARILEWLYRRRLRVARERHAYWRGRREMLERLPLSERDGLFAGKIVRANAKEAKFEERVEALFRE